MVEVAESQMFDQAEYAIPNLEFGVRRLGHTHGPLSSSFVGLPHRILYINHKKELLGGLWVGPIRPNPKP